MPIFDQRVVGGLGEPSATTPRDALAVTLNEKGGLDFERMGQLLGKEPDEVRKALADEGAIFKNPVGGWEESDKYLTGAVRQKLVSASLAAQANPAFKPNVVALGKVQPEDLTPSQIDVSLGAPWVPPEDINLFVAHLVDAFPTGSRRGRGQFFNYVPQTGVWLPEAAVEGNRAKMNSVWGTQRMAAPQIIERMLNSKPVEVNDKDSDGKSFRNATETVAAQEKAVLIQDEFQRWLWDDPERAARLSRHYNDTFNNLRPRVFNGAHQTFPGMNPKWVKQLHSHQKDAIWRVVQDGTSLLAHEVGFGKTAVMVGAGMELRRLGLARKNVFVVPKATHSQFRKQFQDIYPYAKVLFPEQSDFSPENRAELMSRIATGDWDAVIISDTQFRRIPVRPETEQAFIKGEMNDLHAAMAAEDEVSGGRSRTHKELQKALMRMEEGMKESQARGAAVTDNTIFFEDLGIDQMFVDEADMFKNLRFTTRMGRIKGLPNTDSQRATDMFLKVRYLQKQGNGRGVVFATGTPIANTVAEGYTMMRYLQQPMLEERGIQNFDAWARTFGGTTEALEQTPTGAYRVTQRFAKFNNLPELSNMWQTTADIRVASEVEEITKRVPRLINERGQSGRTLTTAPPSDALKRYMEGLAVRADNLKNVDPTEDNMLKIANDARMASLDMRLVEPNASFDPEGKLALATQKVADIYRETNNLKGTQLVFLDIGTPKAVDKPPEEGVGSPTTADLEIDGEVAVLRNVYGDMRNRLVAAGIPDKEIAFIHDAKTNAAKTRLFKQVNRGNVRVLLGSTGKMGVGVNVQKRAAALHHLDAPWRPRDIEQREGRIVRQGNKVYGPTIDEAGEVLHPGRGVRIYNYVTQGSFDAYMWQAIEVKAKAIKSLMRRNVIARSIEDVDSLTISASEAKALASGNPDIMKAVTLKNDINRLKLVQASHTDSIIRAKNEVRLLPMVIMEQEEALAKLQADRHLASISKDKGFALTLGRQTFDKRSEAGEAVVNLLANIPAGDIPQSLGSYRDFDLSISKAPDGFRFIVENAATGVEHTSMPVQEVTAAGAIQRIDNIVSNIAAKADKTEQALKQSRLSLGTFTEQASKPFDQQERLSRLQEQLREVEQRLQAPEGELAQVS